jgi:hypothetical protein
MLSPVGNHSQKAELRDWFRIRNDQAGTHQWQYQEGSGTWTADLVRHPFSCKIDRHEQHRAGIHGHSTPSPAMSLAESPCTWPVTRSGEAHAGHQQIVGHQENVEHQEIAKDNVVEQIRGDPDRGVAAWSSAALRQV